MLAVLMVTTVIGYLSFSDYSLGKVAAIFYGAILFLGLLFSSVGVLMSTLVRGSVRTSGVTITIVFGTFVIGVVRRSLLEGERLFLTQGIKKVTVDELTNAVNIAKGSFYAFYESKEHLYFDILARNQSCMWTDMERWLEDHKELPPRQLVSDVILYVLQIMNDYPLIKATDSETMAVIYRKLPSEVIDTHGREDSAAIETLFTYGVRFKKPMEVVVKSMQALYYVALLLEKEQEALKGEVMATMATGLVSELVEEPQ